MYLLVALLSFLGNWRLIYLSSWEWVWFTLLITLVDERFTHLRLKIFLITAHNLLLLIYLTIAGAPWRDRRFNEL
jgi:hypothetical protein